MDVKQETAKFFDEAFAESLRDVKFPEKAEMIKDKLDELARFFSLESRDIRAACFELQECLHLLESIKKEHQSSVEMPGIFQVPKDIKEPDLDNDLLLNNIELDAVNKIDESIVRLKQCATALAAEEEKNKKDKNPN